VQGNYPGLILDNIPIEKKKNNQSPRPENTVSLPTQRQTQTE
jgi:hypothetical protein